MDITINCSRSQLTPVGYKSISVELEDIDTTEVLDHFSLQDVIKHFGESKILDAIGVDEVKSHFELTEIEE